MMLYSFKHLVDAEQEHSAAEDLKFTALTENYLCIEVKRFKKN